MNTNWHLIHRRPTVGNVHNTRIEYRKVWRASEHSRKAEKNSTTRNHFRNNFTVLIILYFLHARGLATGDSSEWRGATLGESCDVSVVGILVASI